MIRVLLVLFLTLFINLPLFAQSVDTAWVRKYNGPSNSRDDTWGIAVNDSGNVYVTGRSFGIGTFSDYVTIKYCPNGDTAWLRRYNGLGNDYDYGKAIAVDGSGSVYVTGMSLGNGSSADLATIKYNSNGDTAWVRIYNGATNDYDYANAIVVDGSGSVYVTGLSHRSGTSADWVTIKYHPNGDTAWVRMHNGSGNGYDEAIALAVDDSGNLYVSGFSYDSLTNADYTSIKYYPGGDTAWVRRYNGEANGYDHATALVVDPSGNLYVTGQVNINETSSEYVTIKYYTSGETAWVRRYHGPGNSYDRANAITLDNSGNIYVTGRSYGSETSADFMTIKYYPNGDTVWTRRYNGLINGYDEAKAVAVDKSGNVYVTGTSPGIEASDDYITIKYYADGDNAWVKRHNGTQDAGDEPTGIALDSSGNVYVTGHTYELGSDWDYTTIKYVQFLRGDGNGDGNVSVSDIVYLISYLFKQGPAPDPIQSGDANCDGQVSISDIVYLIAHLFNQGPPPCI